MEQERNEVYKKKWNGTERLFFNIIKIWVGVGKRLEKL